ncbi:unnamed protein product [Pleuronectes platessa]|uniref:Uncharacterized protein n=1 Tax=Pleuronectes platessa TaxID=8262 RepID=A0A9N7U5T0_PLEPL|nr:unnamed protein product [Pleuronectes platessa]
MLALKEEVWQLENHLKDRDDIIKMAVEEEKEKEKEIKIETETEREMETEKENEIQALKEKVEQLENHLKDKDVVIMKEQVCTRSLHQEPETRRSSEVEVNKEKDKENENEKVLASGPKGNKTAAGENSNYGTELQKGGGRDELEEREEVEKPPPSPFFYSSKQTPPLSPFKNPLNLISTAPSSSSLDPSPVARSLLLIPP